MNPTAVYQVYRNLNNDMWSIRDVNSGLIVGHGLVVKLIDVRFIVRESGRQRVLQEQRKNVHAFIQGRLEMWCGVNYRDRTDIIGSLRLPTDDVSTNALEVSYNPYRFPHFFDVETLDKVEYADYAYFTADKKVYRGDITC